MNSTPDAIARFEARFFEGELNQFVGSGGEVLVKADEASPPGRLDVGDTLIGIGATHLIENLSHPPGPDAFHAPVMASDFVVKCAARGFSVVAKERTPEGFQFRFGPLTPQAYADTVERVSAGAVKLSASSIPEGTIILSFVDLQPGYTLRTIAGSPGANWRAATRGQRHWNVGVAGPSDFWIAAFPSDDIAALSLLPRQETIGTIRFGLSLLEGSNTHTRLEPVPCIGPGGQETKHDFCLNGQAAGTAGVQTPFPIGVRTAITFRPLSD